MTGRGRGLSLTRPAWMDERGLGATPPAGAPAPPAGAISDWARATAADGRPYWYSLATGATTWEDPAGAPPAKPPAGPAPWREVTTADGRTYYYNEETKKTQWTRPPDIAGAAAADAPNGHPGAAQAAPAEKPQPDTGRRLPDGWAENRAEDGRVYYFHSATRETRWDFPTEAAKDAPSASDAEAGGRKRPAETIGDSRGAPSSAAKDGVGADWKENTTPDGRKYYYNSVTRETSWTKPSEISPDDPAGTADRKRQRTVGPVTDLRQLVSGSNSLKSKGNASGKTSQVLRRPRASDGKALTDHQAETYYLNRAKARKETEASGEAENDVMIQGGVTLHEREQTFYEMMKSKGITAKSSWLETMFKCASDRRYVLLYPYGQRKHAWWKYVQRSAKEQRRDAIIASRTSSESFMTLLSEVFVNEPYTASNLDRCSPEAVKRFETDSRFRAVDERTRAALTKSFFGIRVRKGERERARNRKESISKMRTALDAMIDPELLHPPDKRDGVPSVGKGDAGTLHGNDSNEKAGGLVSEKKTYFTDRTSFRELERFLSDVPGSDSVDSADLTSIIRDWRRYVERLTQAKRTREKEARKAAQRERRAAFRSGVEKMLLRGTISFNARWREVADVVMKEEFAFPEAELDARASALFEDALELFEERVQGQREQFKLLLKEGGIDVQDATTIEDLKKAGKLREFVEGMETPIVAALLADRQRRESKRRQKELQRAVGDFEEVLERSTLTAGTTFDAAKELLKDHSAFRQLQNLGGEDKLKRLFDDFMDWLNKKEQSRQKRKLETQPSVPYDHAALAALQRAKRARLPGPGPPVPANSFLQNSVPLRPEEENGWTAALSAKPMTEKEKQEENERRKQALLSGLRNDPVRAKASPKAAE